ncbi:beta-hexosaminidase subunit beta-like [Daktulosphaira vitifoliae]|uniref:beta-hexosaminidase subunit beta-like n=1 Tax=Daktulosphaira vitifoliae TaxID=58002 RepID=UPI0021AA4E8C|nr:beta-hexosaminidase subunit beta-like [Daktulosphaira vitifoliae]
MLLLNRFCLNVNLCIVIYLVDFIICVNNNGPWVKMSHGQVWPKPMEQRNTNEYYLIEPKNFRLQVLQNNCDDLQNAIKRYKKMLFIKGNNAIKNTISSISDENNNSVKKLDSLKIYLENYCEKYPSLDMNETYTINITHSIGVLTAVSIWGIYRGLETFSQLVYLTEDGTFQVRGTFIKDYPKYSHRGYMLDTSRHFLDVKTILTSLDAMAYSKLNVFHWHIVDDPSFPFESTSFPKLSEKGAYDKYSVYTKADVKHIIEYARLRGIRVIPEFDTPDHTGSWGPGGQPGLLTQCSESDPTILGPIDPTLKENYDFLKTLFTEVKGLFPDEYLHLGGDEVRHDCWDNNTRIVKFMEDHNMSSILDLENYYFQNVFEITNTLNFKSIVWDELFNNKVQLDQNSIVQVWQGDYINRTLNVLESGHYALLSSCWYLNYVQYGTDWLEYYNCDPKNFFIKPEYNHLFLGGEACMWGEFVDDSNVLQFSWPGASAVGEVLWSHTTNETEAAPRLEEHICRLKRRGIPAKPSNGPSFCYY